MTQEQRERLDDSYSDAMVAMLLSADEAQIINVPEDDDGFMDWLKQMGQ